jgi:hypothetical protein
MSSLDEQRSGALKLVTSLSLSLSLSFHLHAKSKTDPARLHGSPWCWRSRSRRSVDTNGWESHPHSWLCRFCVMVAVVCSCVPALHDKICNSTLAVFHYFMFNLIIPHCSVFTLLLAVYSTHCHTKVCIILLYDEIGHRNPFMYKSFIVLVIRYSFATFEVCITTKLYTCPGFLECLCCYCWQGKIQSWRKVASYIYTYKSRKTEVHVILFHHIFKNYKNVPYPIKLNWTIWCTTWT